MLLIPFRIIWQIWPCQATCNMFWGAASAMAAVQLYFNAAHWRFASWVGFTFLVAGMAMNATVTMANGGFMPFTGDNILKGRDRVSLWVRGNESYRLMFLADIHKGFSVGDLFVFGGLSMWFTFWLLGWTQW